MEAQGVQGLYESYSDLVLRSVIACIGWVTLTRQCPFRSGSPVKLLVSYHPPPPGTPPPEKQRKPAWTPK